MDDLIGPIGLTVAAVALSILVFLSFRSGLKATTAEAIVMRDGVIWSAAALMAYYALDHWLGVSDITFVGSLLELICFPALLMIAYGFIVALAFVFRRRFRNLGLQMLILTVLTGWWLNTVDETAFEKRMMRESEAAKRASHTAPQSQANP